MSQSITFSWRQFSSAASFLGFETSNIRANTYIPVYLTIHPTNHLYTGSNNNSCGTKHIMTYNDKHCYRIGGTNTGGYRTRRRYILEGNSSENIVPWIGSWLRKLMNSPKRREKNCVHTSQITFLSPSVSIFLWMSYLVRHSTRSPRWKLINTIYFQATIFKQPSSVARTLGTGFEYHSRYGCLSIFILCLCCPV
jgi:hypothetical protein